MKTTWSGEVLTEDDAAMYALREPGGGKWRVVTRFSTETFGGTLVEDDDGAVLCWNDFVVNEWVELFSTTPVALMRLALLLDAAEREAWFVNDALGFHKFAIEFMHESAPNRMPKRAET